MFITGMYKRHRTALRCTIVFLQRSSVVGSVQQKRFIWAPKILAKGQEYLMSSDTLLLDKKDTKITDVQINLSFHFLGAAEKEAQLHLQYF